MSLRPLERVRRRRRDARLVGALPDLLDRIAGDLRSGATPLTALADAAATPGPLAGDLTRIVDRAAGVGLAAAIAAWPGEQPLPAVVAVAAALEVAVGVGGRAASALEGLAAGLRDRRDTLDEAAALSAQARLSAVVVGVAPLASLGLALAADRRVIATLVGTGPGRACLATGASLQMMAALWMRRIVRCEP